MPACARRTSLSCLLAAVCVCAFASCEASRTLSEEISSSSDPSPQRQQHLHGAARASERRDGAGAAIRDSDGVSLSSGELSAGSRDHLATGAHSPSAAFSVSSSEHTVPPARMRRALEKDTKADKLEHDSNICTPGFCVHTFAPGRREGSGSGRLSGGGTGGASRREEEAEGQHAAAEASAAAVQFAWTLPPFAAPMWARASIRPPFLFPDALFAPRSGADLVIILAPVVLFLAAAFAHNGGAVGTVAGRAAAASSPAAAGGGAGGDAVQQKTK